METKKGFSLVELAIALVIIGLVSGMGITALVTSLAHQRKVVDIEKNLDTLRNGLLALIESDLSKKLPTEEQVDNLTAFETRGNYKYIWNRAAVNDVCNYPTSSCDILVCGNADCNSGNKIISDLMFAVVELGPNKKYDSLYQKAGINDAESCNLKIDKFSETNDDTLIFLTTHEIAAKMRCNKTAIPFEISTDSLPVLYKNKAPKNDTVRLKITETPAVTNIPTAGGYKFCISNPLLDPIVQGPGEFNWIANNNGVTVSMRDMNCDKFGLAASQYYTTSVPYLTLNALGNTQFDYSAMKPGTYLFNINAGYGQVDYRLTKTKKNIVLTLNEE